MWGFDDKEHYQSQSELAGRRVSELETENARLRTENRKLSEESDRMRERLRKIDSSYRSRQVEIAARTCQRCQAERNHRNECLCQK